MISLKSIFISIHVLVWAFVLSLPYYISGPPHYTIGNVPGLFYSLAGLLNVCIFYTNAYYLYPKLLNIRFWWLYFLAIALLLVFSFHLKQLIWKILFPDMLGNVSFYKLIYPASIGAFVVSTIYRKVLNEINKEKHQKEQQAEKLNAELKFLRSQINPHFLFNVLTNLIALARKNSDKLEPSLLMLSDLMRYMLYDSEGKKVTIKQEISYLNSYIALQALRFGEEVNIQTDIHSDPGTDTLQIEPMLLIPFVENAFKHGIDLPGVPFIHIHLRVQEARLRYEVLNAWEESTYSKDQTPGIGLTNVKTRLALLYPKRHELKIDTSNHLFHVLLTLTL